MASELSQAEQNVFGQSAEAHPITGMALENGKGALPHHIQALLHCEVIEQQHGKKVADEFRAKLKAANSKPTGGNVTVQSLKIVERDEGMPNADAIRAAAAAVKAAKE